MNIISILNQPMGGCEYYRQWMPNQLLGEAGHKITHTNSILPHHLINEFSYVQERLEQADLYQFIRRDPLNMVDIARTHGLNVVMDIDDYWLVDRHHEHYDELKATGAELIKLSMEQSDLITTPSRYLAHKIEKYNPNVEVIPNAFTYREPQYQRIDREFDGIVNIGWVGGSHHIMDVHLLQKTMEYLWTSTSLKGNFRMIYGGFMPNSEGHQIMTWMLSHRFHPNSQGLFLPLPAQPINTFMQLYDQCDILLAPLLDTEFNRCKSNLKIIEAGAKGKMIIASDVEPYKYDGVPTVKPSKNKKGWIELLEYYIKNPVQINVESERLHQHVVNNYSLEVVNKQREEIYCSLTGK